MLLAFEGFREVLDAVIVKSLHKQVIIIDYDCLTGRFIRWYASYYHNLTVDYLIDDSQKRGSGHELGLYTTKLFEYNYRNVDQMIIWLTGPQNPGLEEMLRKKGYNKGVDYFVFREIIYGNDLLWEDQDADIDVFHKRKTGFRDVQFMEYLEWKYGCNFVTRIPKNETEMNDTTGAGYGVSTQKEIFGILDHCHCMPKSDDAAFDFGCGKGAPMVAFLDYGFERVGGVEYNPKLVDVARDNLRRLSISETEAKLYSGDASDLSVELDEYNWFYFYYPFHGQVMERVIDNIRDSYVRKKRKMYLIFINPDCWWMIEQKKEFRLRLQTEIDTRSRVVSVYETF